MLLKRQKKRLKNNILLYITICWNIKNHFLNETKQRQEFDMSGMLCNVGGPSIGSYKFSRPNTLAFCLAIRQYLITLFGRYDKRIVIPGKDSTINVYIPIFEWCTNRFILCLIHCSIGDNITQLLLSEKSQMVCSCCTKSLLILLP